MCATTTHTIMMEYTKKYKHVEIDSHGNMPGYEGQTSIVVLLIRLEVSC